MHVQPYYHCHQYTFMISEPCGMGHQFHPSNRAQTRILWAVDAFVQVGVINNNIPSLKNRSELRHRGTLIWLFPLLKVVIMFLINTKIIICLWYDFGQILSKEMLGCISMDPYLDWMKRAILCVRFSYHIKSIYYERPAL